MNLLSIAVHRCLVSFVSVSVAHPRPRRSAPPMIPLKSVMLDGSLLEVRNWTWNGAPGAIVCGIGLGSTLVAASASTEDHNGAVAAAPPNSAAVPMTGRRVTARAQK